MTRVLAWLLVACLAGCSVTARQDGSALTGRWKSVASMYHFDDGTKIPNPSQAQCRIEFAEGRLISECVTSRGRDRIVSTYRVTGPGTYESEVIENKNFPNVIGARVRAEFRVDNGKLFTTVYPPVTKGSAARSPIKVEAVWVRE